MKYLFGIECFDDTNGEVFSTLSLDMKLNKKSLNGRKSYTITMH